MSEHILQQQYKADGANQAVASDHQAKLHSHAASQATMGSSSGITMQGVLDRTCATKGFSATCRHSAQDLRALLLTEQRENHVR